MYPLSNILLATNLSKGEQSLIVYGNDMAKQLSAKVFLLHVYHLPLPASEIDFVYIGELDESIKNKVRHKLQHIEKNFYYSSLPDHEFIIKAGPVEENILTTIEEKKIDLLIMGSSGSQGIWELFGNHITQLINKINCPILVIPENASYRIFRKILLACDFSAPLSHLEILDLIAETYNAEVKILTVTNQIQSLPENEAIGTKILDQIFSKVNHTTEHVIGEDVEEELNNYLSKNNIDLLVTSPHHHSLWSRIVHGSITRSLTFHTKVPLLILNQ